MDPWSEKIPRALGQLSLGATTTEPARLESGLGNKRFHRSEKPIHHSPTKSSPLVVTLRPRMPASSRPHGPQPLSSCARKPDHHNLREALEDPTQPNK